MKLNKIFLPMAALALVGAMTAGCSSDDLATDTPLLPDAASGTVTMKTTITLDERASTRALDADGKKTFAAGDQIAVIYQNTSGETVKAVSDALTATDIDATKAQSATFSVSLTNPKASTPVRYIYPAAMAVNTIATDAAIDDAATIDYTKLATQDGTLASLASTLDLATFDGNMTAQGNLPKTAPLVNPLTIGKFTIKNNATDADITNTITKLTIADGTNTYTITPSTLSTIYVAMKPVTSSQTVNVNATDGTKLYYKSIAGNALEISKIYDVTVNTIQGADLSKLTTNYTAQDGDILSGTLDVANYPVKISIAAGATVTLNNLTINGINDSSYPWAGITCEGDATIILADGSTNTVQGFYEDYPGIFVVEGYTLTISGGNTGKLIASSYYTGAGIGAGHKVNCGNIIISGGDITATGGRYGAGIGSCGKYDTNEGHCGNITISGGNITATGGTLGAGIGGGEGGACGNITISGGTIKANGGDYGAGIGGGDGLSTIPNRGKCGNIIITTSVTKVEATKGSNAQHSIGKGKYADCGTVTIGCTLNSDGLPIGGTTGYISTSPYTYQP